MLSSRALLSTLVVAVALSLALVDAKAIERAIAKLKTKMGQWDAIESGVYTDVYARTYMMPFAAAAYSDDPQVCVGKNFANATVSLHVKSICEYGDDAQDCAGYTAVSHADRAIIIAFRGTANFQQFWTEVQHVIFRPKKPSPIGGHVAEYFMDVFTHLWDRGLGHDLRTLVAQYPSYEIRVTGHSLGGAIASIAGATILHELKVENERIKIVTFGQPRTGDHEYAAAHDKKLPRTYRVVHAHDLVPHLPTKGFERYEHHGEEVWYVNAMNSNSRFIVCKERESHKCSDGQLDVDVNDHGTYFTRWLSKWAVAGCAP